MIFIVTSSTQANDKIKHCLMDRLRLSLSEADFARVTNAEDAFKMISDEDAGIDLVFVAATTYEEAVGFESALRITHPEMPLIVVHRMDRIRTIARPKSADVAFPLRSDEVVQAMDRVLKPESKENMKFTHRLPIGMAQALTGNFVNA
jgi:hypothetical protein